VNLSIHISKMETELEKGTISVSIPFLRKSARSQISNSIVGQPSTGFMYVDQL
jgi:hypothetical protein